MTAPKPSEAAEREAAVFCDRVFALQPGARRTEAVHATAAWLDAFADAAVHDYRRGVNGKQSMVIAREWLEFVNAGWGEIGLGVMEQEIANRMEQHAAEAVAADRKRRDVCVSALCDEVDVLVRRKVIDSRSPAADALLDVRNPPSTKRSDRLVAMDVEVTAPTSADLKRARELFKRINGFSDYDLEHGDASVQDERSHALPHLEQALADAREDGRKDGIREAAQVAEMGRINKDSEFERGKVPMLAGEIRAGIATDILALLDDKETPT